MKIYSDDFKGCKDNMVIDLNGKSFKKCSKNVKDLNSKNYDDVLIHGISFLIVNIISVL